MHTSNRTKVELKRKGLDDAADPVAASNRTKVELKLRLFRNPRAGRRPPLIEPRWN